MEFYYITILLLHVYINGGTYISIYVMATIEKSAIYLALYLKTYDNVIGMQT